MKNKFKRYKEWCPHCDRYRVEAGKKCPVCGKRCYAEKVKKPTSTILVKELLDEKQDNLSILW